MFASMKTQKGKIGLFCRGEIVLTTKQVPKGPKHSSWPCSHALEDAHAHISTWSKLQIQPGQRGRMRSSAQPALHGSAGAATWTWQSHSEHHRAGSPTPEGSKVGHPCPPPHQDPPQTPQINRNRTLFYRPLRPQLGLIQGSCKELLPKRPPC